MTSYPFVNRTLATLRIAEFGFLGVRVITCRQTPRRKGARSKAGDLDLYFNLLRPRRTSWLIVGIATPGSGPDLPDFPHPLGKRSADISKGLFPCNKYLDYQLARGSSMAGTACSSGCTSTRGFNANLRWRSKPVPAGMM